MSSSHELCAGAWNKGLACGAATEKARKPAHSRRVASRCGVASIGCANGTCSALRGRLARDTTRRFSDLASQACAWIILEPGETSDEKEIKEFCCGQIAHYRIPRYVRFTTELPISFTGKKFKMREAMTQ
jgi:acyl-CoA synthetase (AMP-forming)/AMP-acid ligase II